MAYILALLAKLVDEDEDFQAMSDEGKCGKMESVMKMLETEVQLRSKRELVERFFREQMPQISSGAAVQDSFDAFWAEEQVAALNEFCQDEVQKIITDLNFTGQMPLHSSVAKTLVTKPKILERRTIVDHVTEKIMKIIRTFEDGIGGGE